MCGAPERLPAFGACTLHIPCVITTILDQKLQLLKPLNKRELYASKGNRRFLRKSILYLHRDCDKTI
jgi:hypothetical protein